MNLWRMLPVLVPTVWVGGVVDPLNTRKGLIWPSLPAQRDFEKNWKWVWSQQTQGPQSCGWGLLLTNQSFTNSSCDSTRFLKAAVGAWLGCCYDDKMEGGSHGGRLGKQGQRRAYLWNMSQEEGSNLSSGAKRDNYNNQELLDFLLVAMKILQNVRTSTFVPRWRFPSNLGVATANLQEIDRNQ